MANIGKTPQNQLDALPLQDADSAAAGGNLQVVGGVITRYFTGAVLGINGVAVQTVNTKVCLVTNYLDLRGCSKFIFTLRVTNPAARGALPACSLTVQTRQGASDTPSASYIQGGGINDIFNSIYLITATTYTFPATTAANETQTAVWPWYEGTSASATAGNAVTIGTDCRLIVSWSTNAVPAANLFTANLWASG